MLDYFRLDGKTALVTGGASGIGESTVRTFAEAGATVIIGDLNENRAQELAKTLPKAEAYRCDITSEAEVKDLFQRIARLDILVNNAGIGLVGGIEETERVDFQRLFRVNVEGTFLVTRAALPKLVAAHGSIVNIGS